MRLEFSGAITVCGEKLVPIDYGKVHTLELSATIKTRIGGKSWYHVSVVAKIDGSTVWMCTFTTEKAEYKSTPSTTSSPWYYKKAKMVIDNVYLRVV